ncbi:hypothetical protein CsSME_00027521 [Camellia sinensis var. sinensis]
MLCGRKNLDRFQPEEDMHLLGLFKRKVEEERLLDIVDKYNDDMQTHRAEVVEMMRVAVWCLQTDFSIRPSMLVVVKVFEGSIDVGSNLDYSFTTAVVPRAITVAGHQEDDIGAATSLFPLALSKKVDYEQITVDCLNFFYFFPSFFSFFFLGLNVLEFRFTLET